MPASGGPPARITSDGGFDPRESPDGRTLYFVDDRRWYGRPFEIRLKRVSTRGGPTSVIHSGVSAGAWDVTDAGVLFVPPNRSVLEGPRRPDTLALYDFKQERVRILGELPFPVAAFGVDRFVAASRDGRWALLNHIDRWDRDIMVLDNVR